jgi:hypothetical protein
MKWDLGLLTSFEPTSSISSFWGLKTINYSIEGNIGYPILPSTPQCGHFIF